MKISELLTLGLAVFRLARLIAEDEGPFSVFLITRIKAGAYDYNERGVAQTSLGRGIGCPFCVGMYAAGLLMLLHKTRLGKFVVNVLAIAGVQSLAQVWAGSVTNGSNER